MGRGLRQGIGIAMMSGAVAFGAAGAAAAQAPPTGEPFAIESTALVPLDAESAVSISGIHGQITIMTRDERELRVVSRGPGPQGAELPVGMWQDGSKLIVAPAPGDKGGASQLRVEVPRGFAIAVDAADSDISIQSAWGGVDLHGTNLRVTVNGNSGSLIADLEGGSLALRDSNEATLRVSGTAVDVSGMSGSVNVRAVGGKIVLGKISGSTDVESDESKLVLDGLSGSIHVKANKGEATIMGIKAGGELAMSGTPLHLKEGKGDITVTSDASVDFETMEASMHLDMYGGALRGKGNKGILEVRTRNTEINVEAIEQGMRIQGDGVKAKIVDVGGELYVETTISEVVVDRAGSVDLRIDRGNATIQRAAGAVQAIVAGGDVHIIDGSGPVTLDLDGGDAEVSWASMSGDKESKLTNKSGNVTVHFPASGVCRVEAKSKYGRIDTDLPTVKVMDDLTEAQGPVNGGYRPLVRVVANGDIHLLGAARVQDENN